MTQHVIYSEAPHTGLSLAISNISAGSRQGVEIRPDALRNASEELLKLADLYASEGVEIAA